MKPDNFRIFLLAYPDNPAGSIFLKTLLDNGVPVTGVVVEEQSTGSNWERLQLKWRKDGWVETAKRIFTIVFLKSAHKTIIDEAARNEISVYTVEAFNSDACVSLLRHLKPDLLAISSAPILRESVFRQARLGCLNAHPGWLPAYRGLGGNAYALQDGQLPAVTVHFIDSGIDTGPIIARERLAIQPKDTVARINDRALIRGAELMAKAIHDIMSGCLTVPDIREPRGPCFRIMPYKLTRRLNRILRYRKDSLAI